MNIMLVTICYPPEIRSISTMMQELAEELIRRGHRVTVLTSWPQYNLSDEAKKKHFEVEMVENGVKVIRIKTLRTHHIGYLMRGIAQVTLPYFFSKAIKRFIKEKVDAVIVYTPHLPLTILGARIKKAYNAKYLLNVQDIFPQNAIDLGVMKNKWVIKFFERMEMKAYNNADAITTHTNSGRRFLIEKKGVPSDKVYVVPNWIDVSIFDSKKATGKFREQYKLKDKFIFLFPGILGPSQNLDFIVEVAQKVSDLKDICFLFVGDGTEKDRIQQLVQARGLQNIQFEPFVSPEKYPSLLKEVDVGLMCLGVKSKTPAVPGKLFGFMASSLSVVAFLNKESEGYHIIKEAQCGYSLFSDNAEKAAAFIRKIFNQKNQLDELGRNGYKYVVANFSKQKCIDKLEQLIMQRY